MCVEIGWWLRAVCEKSGRMNSIAGDAEKKRGDKNGRGGIIRVRFDAESAAKGWGSSCTLLYVL